MKQHYSATRFLGDIWNREATSDYSFVYYYLFAGIMLVVTVFLLLPRLS